MSTPGRWNLSSAPMADSYFLEMNTRLQVEHPVTEMTTGLDLVREQIRLPKATRSRFNNRNSGRPDTAIECRIYAEVPEENFQAGHRNLAIYRPPIGPGIRLDSGVEQNSEVSFHYDPMLAKLDRLGSHARCLDRSDERALSEFVLLGVRNNIEFFNRVISHPDFRQGKIDTQFLERHSDLMRPPVRTTPVEALIAASLSGGSSTAKAAASGAPAFPDVWASGPWRIS